MAASCVRPGCVLRAGRLHLCGRCHQSWRHDRCGSPRVILPAGFALLLGYFLFYGRISDVYLGVITLTVTLIFFKFINSTAGDMWTIGQAPFGGFNGIPMTPPLNFPGDITAMLMPNQIFILSIIGLLFCYVIAKLILASHFGRVVVAVKENELRAELLGYDVRLYKLVIFTIGGRWPA